MSGLDHVLVYEARKFINAENVHRLNTWIFCYETTESDTPRHTRYEVLLREFVATKRLMLGAHEQAKLVIEHGTKLRKASTALDEKISTACSRCR